MNILDLSAAVSETSYPGRGIIIGKGNGDFGDFFAIAYFIMGRSLNSRNRIFEEYGNHLRTKAFDESKMVDPSLIIYNPVLVHGDVTVVTNGDQTNTIVDFLKAGNTFEDALRTREFEPDAPNFTPRISGIIDCKQDLYKLSILKTLDGDEDISTRYFYEYNNVKSGLGHFIHTYNSDGDPLPSFTGEPRLVKIPNDIEKFTNTIWDNLDRENKVSLFTRFIDVKTGDTITKIVNKNL